MKDKKFALIVPVAADKVEYEGAMPYLFRPDSDGILLCVKSVLGLRDSKFDTVYFTILRKHAEAFDIDTLLQLQFRRLGIKNAQIVILEEPTKSQAETIARTIEQENIEGAIFIKDADGYFTAEILPENGVAVYPLESLELVDPRNKSYVAVDDMYYITNIIEKRVVSHYFNAGGYCFEDARDFLRVYHDLKDEPHLYLSHIIYSLLLEKQIFRPIQVKDYRDWGTDKMYRLDQLR